VERSLRLLVNPRAGRGARLLKHREPLARAGIEVVVTRDAREMAEQAAAAARAGLDRILVGGGDGTLHHAVQGLAGTDCALGVVPSGSGNDLARALSIDRRPLRALDRALRGTPGRIDLGRVGNRHFLGAAGLGFDGDVAAYVASRPRRSGRLAYPWAVLRTLPAFEPPHLTIEHDGGQWSGPVMLAVAANSPYFGGGMRIAPSATLDDGMLDLIIVRAMARLRLLALFHRVYRGTHVHHPAVSVIRLRRAEIRADRPLDVYADGERLFPLPPEGATFEAAPSAVAVIQ
jgi:diacylglycerol kinase (ATP)